MKEDFYIDDIIRKHEYKPYQDKKTKFRIITIVSKDELEIVELGADKVTKEIINKRNAVLVKAGINRRRFIKEMEESDELAEILNSL